MPLPAPSQDGATDRQHSAPATFQHLRLRFDGANDAASLSAERQLPGIVNYLTGNHRA